MHFDIFIIDAFKSSCELACLLPVLDSDPAILTSTPVQTLVGDTAANTVTTAPAQTRVFKRNTCYTIQPQQGTEGEGTHRDLPRVCHKCGWGWLCFFSLQPNILACFRSIFLVLCFVWFLLKGGGGVNSSIPLMQEKPALWRVPNPAAMKTGSKPHLGVLYIFHP